MHVSSISKPSLGLSIDFVKLLTCWQYWCTKQLTKCEKTVKFRIGISAYLEFNFSAANPRPEICFKNVKTTDLGRELTRKRCELYDYWMCVFSFTCMCKQYGPYRISGIFDSTFCLLLFLEYQFSRNSANPIDCQFCLAYYFSYKALVSGI